jgi:cytochrome c-type biogenesis protein CcmE
MSTWIWVVIVTIVVATTLIGLSKLSSSRNWSATEGKVISSSVQELRRTNQMLINEGASNFEYKVNVQYEYSVNGQSYSNDVVFVGLPTIFDDKSDADNIVAKYEGDKTIEVFYEPNNPQNAALITAKNISITGLVVMLLMVVGIASGIIILLKSGILNS